MQKAVISPLNNVTFKGGDQHSEGGDKQKKTSLLGLLSEPKMKKKIKNYFLPMLSFWVLKVKHVKPYC